MGKPTQPTQPKTEKLEDVMGTSTNTSASNKSTPAHYVLTVEGTALIDGKEQEYSVEVKVPDLGQGKGDGHYMTFALDSERGDYLMKAIKKKYGKCESTRFRYLVDRRYVDGNGTVNPVSSKATEATENLTVSNMRKAELLKYIKEMKYPINVELYPRTDELRSAVLNYQTSPEEFAIQQAKDEEAFRIQQEAKQLNG